MDPFLPKGPQADTAAPTGSLLAGRRRLLLIGVTLAVAFAYFAYVAFDSATAYYLTVDELVERGYSDGLGAVRVKGSLVPDSFFREEGSLVAHFTLAEGGEQVAATYDGVVPDLFFNPHSELVLTGEYSPSGLFSVEEVLIKCPSKYQSVEYAVPPPPSF